MFSYNSFKSGYNKNSEKNMPLQEESKGIIPLAPDKLLPLEQQGCSYDSGNYCVFDDYEPMFTPASNSNNDIYIAQRPHQERPYLSNNPLERKLVLFKELVGYPNYGNPSGNADILYTGNTGEWDFNLPPTIAHTVGEWSTLQIRITLDDHMEVPLQNYSTIIRFNGKVLYDGILRASHGKPAGTKFTNWRLLSFKIDNIRRDNIVEITNSSRTSPDHWIGIDWIQFIL